MKFLPINLAITGLLRGIVVEDECFPISNLISFSLLTT